ncbi:MAG: hypothetical protein EOO89_01885 [Pedobacter sp.]|nr:MAG: hypothetical protein EOO89_01885 [Pedobacter sp.]
MSTSNASENPSELTSDHFRILRDSYFGVKYGQYYFSGREVIESLQAELRRIDLFKEEVKFDPENAHKYPIVCKTPLDWLTVQGLITSAELGATSKTSKLPALIINCGGRKIRFPVGGNRYAYDMGQLSTETVRTDPNEFGEDAIKKSLTYISYKEILENLPANQDVSIAQEVFRLLKGSTSLSAGFSRYLPVMVCAVFGSEVARNPVSMISSLMLLNLIEKQIAIPCLDGKLFSFSSSLWGIEYHIGGFFAMSHTGSFKNEFSEDRLPLQHLCLLLM